MRYLVLTIIITLAGLILLVSYEPGASEVELTKTNPPSSSTPTTTAPLGELMPGQTDINLLVKAMIRIESSNNPRARSRRGARGLLQIRPRTWRWVCRNLLKTKWDFYQYAYDPEKNIIVGYTYLNYLIARFGSIDAALCAYNCGPRHYINNRIPPATFTYLKKVKKLYKELANSRDLCIVKSLNPPQDREGNS